MTRPVELAEHLAEKFHAGQTYGELPYTYHLDMVAKQVAKMFPGDERLVVIAWLHDILEDTDCPQAVLEALFEDKIVDAVVAMTYQHGKKLTHIGGCYSDETKKDTLDRCKANELARKCKLSDSFCNLSESMTRGNMKNIAKYGTVLAILAS